ncbi:hypothetical protein BJV78DRAFT_1353630 [Lactifluus subvellereus]|nr:hypothetical protein BJV78DRAFT_1353630 [Lactifluus subvellereus]
MCQWVEAGAQPHLCFLSLARCVCTLKYPGPLLALYLEPLAGRSSRHSSTPNRPLALAEEIQSAFAVVNTKAASYASSDMAADRTAKKAVPGLDCDSCRSPRIKKSILQSSSLSQREMPYGSTRAWATNPLIVRRKSSGTQAYRLSAQRARRPGFDTVLTAFPSTATEAPITGSVSLLSLLPGARPVTGGRPPTFVRHITMTYFRPLVNCQQLLQQLEQPVEHAITRGSGTTNAPNYAALGRCQIVARMLRVPQSETDLCATLMAETGVGATRHVCGLLEESRRGGMENKGKGFKRALWISGTMARWRPVVYTWPLWTLWGSKTTDASPPLARTQSENACHPAWCPADKSSSGSEDTQVSAQRNCGTHEPIGNLKKCQWEQSRDPQATEHSTSSHSTSVGD